MGIQGLLPMLKEIQEHGHIDRFKGKRLAVDAYVWLHKGAFGCAESLVKGERNTKFVDYAMHRIRMLRHYGIEPYVVFDGGPLPAKKVTEVSRAQSRAAHLARAQSLEAQGRKNEARDAYTKCLDITPELAYQLIKALRLESVDYVVAPYEADAQLCFLEREGYVDGIITEDSDLLVFGCKQVIFKMDGHGQCVWINRQKLGNVSSFPMHGWTDEDFRRMAMLSGCDYLPSVQGMGIKTAHRMLRRCKTVDKVLHTLKMDGAMDIPPTYIAQFNQAELAFQYQRVYCPGQKRIVTLNDLPEAGLSEEDQRWIGLDLDPETAQGLARGDIHPETREPIVDPWPQYTPDGIRSAVKVVLGQSSRGNVSGPMDAFIQRSKLPKALPVTPVGVMRSGRSSMHEEMIFSAGLSGPSRLTTGETSTIGVTSKHFKNKRLTEKQELEIAIEHQQASLQWEEESDEDGPEVEFSQTPNNGKRARRTHSHGPSSPPDISPHVTPTRPKRGGPASLRPESSQQQPLSSPPQPNTRASHPTSPMSAPALSTPPASSPADSYTADPFSPSPRRRRPRSPIAGHIDEDDLVPDTQDWNIYAAPILIPASSPAVRLISSGSKRAVRTVQGSSDSFEEEDIRTPSATTSRKRKVKEEIVDPVDQAANQKAELIGMGWRAKYSFTGASPFPAPRSTRITKMSKVLQDVHPESPVPAETKGSVLRTRPSNLDTTVQSPVPAKRSPTKVSKIEPPADVVPEQPVRQYVSSQATSILERFRYTGVRL